MLLSLTLCKCVQLFSFDVQMTPSPFEGLRTWKLKEACGHRDILDNYRVIESSCFLSNKPEQMTLVL